MPYLLMFFFSHKISSTHRTKSRGNVYMYIQIFFKKENFETEIIPAVDFSWTDGPCDFGRRHRVKLERLNNYLLPADGREGVARTRQAHTVCLSSFFSCRRHCTPQPFPTPLFLFHAFLAYLPPSIEEKNKTGAGPGTLFSIGMPPARSSSRSEAQQVPKESHQCQHCQPASPNHRPSGFLIGEAIKYLFHLRQFRLKCLLFTVKSPPNAYTPVSPRLKPPSIRGNYHELKPQKLPNTALGQTYFEPKPENWNKHFRTYKF